VTASSTGSTGSPVPNPCRNQSCELEIIRLTGLQGGTYLGVPLAVVLLATVVLFRRRDVG